MHLLSPLCTWLLRHRLMEELTPLSPMPTSHLWEHQWRLTEDHMPLDLASFACDFLIFYWRVVKYV
jgi:hypothetical protein